CHHVPRDPRGDRLARRHLAGFPGSGDRGSVRVDDHPVPAPGLRSLAGGEGQVNSSMNNTPDGSTSRSVSAVAPKEGGGFPNPGLPPHVPRQADLSKAAEKRAERVVAAMFVLSVVGSVVSVLAYFLVSPTDSNIFAARRSHSVLWWSNLVAGLGLAIAVFLIGAAVVLLAKTMMPDEEMVEERHDIPSPDEAREVAGDITTDGLD